MYRLVLTIFLAVLTASSAFTTLPKQQTLALSQQQQLETVIFAKGDDDLSDFESRDMTRKEMEDLNAQNEDIMNMELTAMTGFSLVLSVPILYLCWVAFFSD
mmetsp:Transcript_7783/g.8918  ORF Transcript_7783/g.8918 Transcript_7783/m.8918 type:complete len:102 (+) Transcript_7783:61-366(+)